MPLNCLIPSPDWDNAIFKVLANNDTGNAKGHQGGIVIPKELRPFFPGLSGSVSHASPTIDRRVTAELFNQNNYLKTVDTRYQFQTWGGTRSPESRLTDHLTALRNLASGEDFLILQRRNDSLTHFRLTLVPKASSDYATVAALIGSRRWGVLQGPAPVTETDLEEAKAEESAIEAASFSLFDLGAATAVTTVKQVARSLAFRVSVIKLYDETCSFCGQALKSPSGLLELDAAHVVPRSLYGSDDARNGFALCKRHHWAFDNGLAGVSDVRTIKVALSASALPANHLLKLLDGTSIREATSPKLGVDPAAFEWHRKNIFQS